VGLSLDSALPLSAPLPRLALVDDAPRSEQLRWQCRRGMLELDFVLERFLDEHFEAAEKDERVLFAALLTAQDPELQTWLLNGVAHPDAAYHALIRKIRGI
jgi:antitoxin CptB